MLALGEALGGGPGEEAEVEVDSWQWWLSVGSLDDPSAWKMHRLSGSGSCLHGGRLATLMVQARGTQPLCTLRGSSCARECALTLTLTARSHSRLRRPQQSDAGARALTLATFLFRVDGVAAQRGGAWNGAEAEAEGGDGDSPPESCVAACVAHPLCLALEAHRLTPPLPGTGNDDAWGEAEGASCRLLRAANASKPAFSSKRPTPLSEPTILESGIIAISS